MPRPQLNSYEKKLRKEISNNLKRLSQGMTQNQISNKTGIPSSTISGYFAQRSTINAGNAQKLATLFNVSIDEIDPRFKEEIFSKDKLLSQINTTSSKLEPPRQQVVLETAETQLEEQREKEQQEQIQKEKHSKVSNIEDKRKPKNDLPVQEEYENVQAHTILSAGAGTDTIDGGIDQLTIKQSDIPNKFDMVASVAGDSMYPQFEHGDIVFIRFQKDIEKGMIAAVEINKEMFIKRVYLEDTRIRLVSLNDDLKENGEPLYPDFFADEVDDIHLVGKVIDKVSVKRI